MSSLFGFAGPGVPDLRELRSVASLGSSGAYSRYGFAWGDAGGLRGTHEGPGWLALALGELVRCADATWVIGCALGEASDLGGPVVAVSGGCAVVSVLESFGPPSTLDGAAAVAGLRSPSAAAVADAMARVPGTAQERLAAAMARLGGSQAGVLAAAGGRVVSWGRGVRVYSGAGDLGFSQYISTCKFAYWGMRCRFDGVTHDHTAAAAEEAVTERRAWGRCAESTAS